MAEAFLGFQSIAAQLLLYDQNSILEYIFGLFRASFSKSLGAIEPMTPMHGLIPTKLVSSLHKKKQGTRMLAILNPLLCYRVQLSKVMNCCLSVCVTCYKLLVK